MAVGKGARKSQDSISTKNIPTYICIWDSAHRLLGWNVVGLNLDYFYNHPLVSWAFPTVSNPHFLVLSTFVHKIFQIVGKMLGKTWDLSGIWAFSSLWNQICSLKAGFTTRKLSFLPVINTIPTSALKVLFSAHLDVLASAVHILKLERYRED